jgi:hypothetical protein
LPLNIDKPMTAVWRNQTPSLVPRVPLASRPAFHSPQRFRQYARCPEQFTSPDPGRRLCDMHRREHRRLHLHETEPPRKGQIDIFHDLVGTIPQFLWLATARLFSRPVWWVLGPVLGIFISYLLVAWMYQSSVSVVQDLVSNAFIPIGPLVCWLIWIFPLHLLRATCSGSKPVR